MATPLAETGCTTDTGAIANATIIIKPPTISNPNPSFHVSFEKYVFKTSFLNVNFGNDFVPFFCNALPMFMLVEAKIVTKTAKNPEKNIYYFLLGRGVVVVSEQQ